MAVLYKKSSNARMSRKRTDSIFVMRPSFKVPKPHIISPARRVPQPVETDENDVTTVAIVEPVTSTPFVKTLPIFTLNFLNETWSAINTPPILFNFRKGGEFSKRIREQVICDLDFCLCAEKCHCGSRTFVQTSLFCDGSFTQRFIHRDDDGTNGSDRVDSHNIYLKPCGEASCYICEGAEPNFL